MKYPIGIQTFDKIVEGGYAYVDKTNLVYQLAHYAQNIFLSRPRRFGKSLLVSTLQAYFEGRKELFTKFSQLSIFSELNNLKILTMKKEYATVCGFTEEELLGNYKDGICELAEENALSYDEAVAELRNHYDGYHFSENTPGIYNPFSIINALDDKSLDSYWFSSGTPTFLIELLQQKNIDMLQLDEIWASKARFDVPTEKISDPIPVLYQSGYLTIKEYDKGRKQYRLGFPNEEVRQGFSTSLFRYYSDDSRTIDDWEIS